MSQIAILISLFLYVAVVAFLSGYRIGIDKGVQRERRWRRRK